MGTRLASQPSIRHFTPKVKSHLLKLSKQIRKTASQLECPARPVGKGWEIANIRVRKQTGTEENNKDYIVNQENVGQWQFAFHYLEEQGEG